MCKTVSNLYQICRLRASQNKGGGSRLQLKWSCYTLEVVLTRTSVGHGPLLQLHMCDNPTSGSYGQGPPKLHMHICKFMGAALYCWCCRCESLSLDIAACGACFIGHMPIVALGKPHRSHSKSSIAATYAAAAAAAQAVLMLVCSSCCCSCPCCCCCGGCVQHWCCG